MAEKKGIPLTSVAGFPADVAAKLAGLWITTAEELVGAAVQEDGLAGLAGFTGLDESEMTRLVELAQAALPPSMSFAPGDIDRHGLGALDEPPAEPPGEEPTRFAPLPPAVDLHGRLPGVRNQGQRGSCVAFACTAVREMLLGQPSTQADLSEQFLYWNAKQHDGYPGEGTYVHLVMGLLKSDGICPEPVWPYVPTPIPGNIGQDPPPPDARNKALPYRITDTQKITATWVDSIREVLAENRPVAFAVPVYTYWFSEPARSTGDIRLPLPTDPKEGGHAMCMVGYEVDATAPGGGVFLVRNSWGTGWAGNNSLAPGHCRIPFDYISQYSTAAFSALVSEVPPEPVEPEQPLSFWQKLMEFLKRLFGG
ncbi:MAG: C1 family peptidase [Anaerolineaceae bacterium]|nr:C1 family peptidase [Anaerolineaceae bacterium]